jgi:prophage maintenance system killer protein
MAYTAGIVRNHPLVDGNKRTGFVVGILFLELNGYHFTAEEEDATQAVVKVPGLVLHIGLNSSGHRQIHCLVGQIALLSSLRFATRFKQQYG